MDYLCEVYGSDLTQFHPVLHPDGCYLTVPFLQIHSRIYNAECDSKLWYCTVASLGNICFINSTLVSKTEGVK